MCRIKCLQTATTTEVEHNYNCHLLWRMSPAKFVLNKFNYLRRIIRILLMWRLFIYGGFSVQELVGLRSRRSRNDPNLSNYYQNAGDPLSKLVFTGNSSQLFQMLIGPRSLPTALIDTTPSPTFL